ncbi:hypothetical protein ACTXT7_013221 [Hymenolepis weldensis]
MQDDRDIYIPQPSKFEYIRTENGSSAISGLMVLRVNANADADADAYVEILQTTVVKPPYIDSIASGGRPYVFQQDSAPSHKALKFQDWMDGRDFLSSYHTKLTASSLLIRP